MGYNIICLTPVKHIAGVWDNLNKLGTVSYAPDADYHKALMFSCENDIAFVNPNKMGYRMDEYFISEAKLKYIVTASTGTNHIDLKAAEKYQTQVISLTTEMNVINRISSTAEHALALTLSLIRNIPRSFDAVKRFEWDYEPYVGRQMDKMTVGVIGVGRLGAMYAGYVHALGSEVMFVDPNVNNIPNLQTSKVALSELLERSDIISLHVHLRDDTFRMVNEEFISKCKKPYLINTSRGDIVDEKAVIKALEQGDLRGYATDVIADEFGSIRESEVVSAAKRGLNIIITPHVGGMTVEAQEIAYNGVIKILKGILCAKS